MAPTSSRWLSSLVPLRSTVSAVTAMRLVIGSSAHTCLACEAPEMPSVKAAIAAAAIIRCLFKSCCLLGLVRGVSASDFWTSAPGARD